jgi:polar amino acid transport system substrate-binding protein
MTWIGLEPMKRKLYPVILSVVLAITSHMTAFADTLSVVTLHYPPYCYDENGEVKGFGADLLREVFRRMDIPIQIKVLPWKRALKMVKDGKADAVFLAFKTDEREQFADFPEEVFITEPTSFFVRKDSDITWDGDLSSMSMYKFTRPLGYSSGTEFDTAVKTGVIPRIEDAGSPQITIRKLIKERVDILVANRYVILDELKKMNKVGEIKELEPVINEDPSYLAFSKKRNMRKVIENYVEVIKSMKNDGSYQRIIDEFFEQ